MTEIGSALVELLIKVVTPFSLAFTIGRFVDLFITQAHQGHLIRRLEWIWLVVQTVSLPDLRKRLASFLSNALSSRDGLLLSRDAVSWSAAASVLLTFLAVSFGWYLRGTYPSVTSAIRQNLTELDVALMIAVNLPFDVATVAISSWCFRRISAGGGFRFAAIVLFDLFISVLLSVGCVYVGDFLTRSLLNATTYGAPVTAFSVLSGFRSGYLAVADPLHCEAGAIGFLTIFYSATLFLPTLVLIFLLVIVSIARAVAVFAQWFLSTLVQSATEQRGNSFKVFQLTFGTVALVISMGLFVGKAAVDLLRSGDEAKSSGKEARLLDCLVRHHENTFRTESAWRLLVLSAPDGVESRVFDTGENGWNVALNEVRGRTADKVSIDMDLLTSTLWAGPIEKLHFDLPRFVYGDPVIGQLRVSRHCFLTDVVFDSLSAFAFIVVVDKPGSTVCQALRRMRRNSAQ